MLFTGEQLVSCLTFRNVRLLFHLPGFTENVRTCPICGGRGRFEDKNRDTPLHRCVNCGHMYAKRLPKQRILNLMYSNFSYWEGDKAHQGITQVERGEEWSKFLSDRMGILRKTGVIEREGPLDIFEIGCSEGMLLSELARLGHLASGCEMNAEIVEEGAKKLGVDVMPAMFEDLDLPAAHYDLVLSFHTIEHTRYPVDVLRKVNAVLKPGGAVLVEVPNGDEDDRENRGHLHFFSEESLRRLLGMFFERVEIHENRFDSYYGGTVGSFYGVGKGVKK